MEITLLQGIIITLVVMVLVVDRHLEALFLFRPIIVCPIVGAILGDLNTGLVAGGMAGVTPMSIMPYVWYCMLMIVCAIIFIIIGFPKLKMFDTETDNIHKEHDIVIEEMKV